MKRQTNRQTKIENVMVSDSDGRHEVTDERFPTVSRH